MTPRIIPFALLLLGLLAPMFVSSQQYLKPNEKLVLSFFTKNDKLIEVAMDTTTQYLVYRQGSGDMVEYEFPSNLDESWDRFEYSWYLRGGGRTNEGTDLNYLYFEDGNKKYVIYQVFVDRTGETEYGVKTFSLSNNDETELIGFEKTAKGSLIQLRESEQIRIGQEIFN